MFVIILWKATREGNWISHGTVSHHPCLLTGLDGDTSRSTVEIARWVFTGVSPKLRKEVAIKSNSHFTFNKPETVFA